MSGNKYKNILDDWHTLSKECIEMESKHDVYLSKMRELSKLQEACLKAVKHASYRLNQINADLKSLEKNTKVNEEDASDIETMKREMVELESKLAEMKGELPVPKNGLYLSIILGSNLNLSLLNKNDRYRYKQDYEKFKLSVTYAQLLLIVVALFFRARIFDSLLNFVLVWYYCTLTIREAILSINGSRIKGWWMTHHYVSCVLSGVTLTWKDSECYRAFRTQFLLFVLYIAFVQVLQSQYQRGCLRRLHALGQRHSMDITVEGFSSWMFRGLTFLIPFLVLAYIFQFYNCYVLITLHNAMDCAGQWQVPALAVMFFLVGCCNSFTLLRVIINKFKQSGSYSTLFNMQTKYRFNKLE
uniref:TMPIT-like protein n=2 Tax=Ascaris TaxID=6251 RepID=A0A9J2PYD3_ASCLU